MTTDERITPFGRWLRATAMDELPQLFQIFSGIKWLQEEVGRAEEKTKATQIALQQFKEQHRTLPVGKEEQESALKEFYSRKEQARQQKGWWWRTVS